MQGSDSNVTTYSPRALLSLIMLGIFAYFQYLSMDNKYFLLLTFSSYIFLAIGVALLFSATAEPQPRRRRIFVNITVLIFIAGTLIAANSLATIPRGASSTLITCRRGVFQRLFRDVVNLATIAEVIIKHYSSQITCWICSCFFKLGFLSRNFIRQTS